jgi:flagellar hook-basal body complex protein FliE
MAITAIAGGVAGAAGVPAGAAAGVPDRAAGGFAESLGRLVGASEDASAQANDAVGRMLDGSGDVHDAMIALQRADMTLQLTVQIRNKLVSAYQEIMRMPI